MFLTYHLPWGILIGVVAPVWAGFRIDGAVSSLYHTTPHNPSNANDPHRRLVTGGLYPRRGGALLRPFRILAKGGSSASRVSSIGQSATTDVAISSTRPATELELVPAGYNASSVDIASVELDDLWKMLQTSTTGLTAEQVQARLSHFGPNQLATKRPKSIWKLVLEQFEDRLVQILLVVAILSGVFSYLELRDHLVTSAMEYAEISLWKSFVEPAVIMTILILNATVGVWQSRSAADSLAALQKLQPRLATVIRDQDTTQVIEASQLVPGDVIQIRVGDKIPADARLLSLQSSVLAVDEGSLTGESTTVNKIPGAVAKPHSPVQDQRGMLFAGTVVTRGSGQALVVQTGADTQFGKIQTGVAEAAQLSTRTPLAIKLDEFGRTLTIVIGVICVAVWIVSIPKMNDPSFGGNWWQGALYYAKVAVALGVAAIPEGLPAVITLCLSLGTRRMAERNVVVRQLQSVETLGCTSVICTDKTGTLTTNEMTAVSLVVFQKKQTEEHRIEGYSYCPAGYVEGIVSHEEVKSKPNGAVADIAAVCALCNDAKIIGNDEALENELKKNNGKESIEKIYERVGEPTEAALCVLAEKLGGMAHYFDGPIVDRQGLHVNIPPSEFASANVDAWRQNFPRLCTLEFSRDRKSMSVLCRQGSGSNRLLVKGAPNLLLERCTRVKLRDGTVMRITGELRREITEKLSQLAARPLRCLALAVKDDTLEKSLKTFVPDGEVITHPLLSNPESYRDIESDLTLVGIVGIKDPARPEVADSINQCTRAGIRVLMITGDAKDTAVAIARDVNIFPADKDAPVKAFEGREFFMKSEKEQLEILKEDNIVFCRAEPADKQKLVRMLQVGPPLNRNSLPCKWLTHYILEKVVAL